MDLEIVRARSDVEPFSFVDDDATNFSALRNPIRQYRNERNFLSRRKALEDGRVPERDVCEIVVAGNAAVVPDVNDSIFPQRNLGT